MKERNETNHLKTDDTLASNNVKYVTEMTENFYHICTS